MIADILSLTLGEILFWTIAAICGAMLVVFVVNILAPPID